MFLLAHFFIDEWPFAAHGFMQVTFVACLSINQFRYLLSTYYMGDTILGARDSRWTPGDMKD